jgi:hypothetical protein
MKDCTHKNITLWKYYPHLDSDEKETHAICHICGGHWYNGKFRTKEVWERYINSAIGNPEYRKLITIN